MQNVATSLKCKGAQPLMAVARYAGRGGPVQAPRRDPAGLSGGDTSQHKALLRKALLRWHPDKWMALAEKIPKEEHGELGRRLSTITQALVEQKNSSE